MAEYQHAFWHIVNAGNRRLELDTNRLDFMTPILQHRKDEKGGGMSRPGILANMYMSIIAGSDSVATNLGRITYNLLQVQRR